MLRLTRVLLSVFGALGVALSLAAAPAQAGEDAALSVSDREPPAELADEIRSALQSTVVRLAEGDKPALELWVRKEIPLASKPAPDVFPLRAVKQGTLLGAVKVYQERYDFKDDEIPPGVYVARFALQPEDGNHLGTSPSPTFVLLSPAADDRRLEGSTDPDELSEASSMINAAEHPSNLNLQPATEEGGEFPRLSSHHGGDHKVIYMRVPATVAGGNDRLAITFALVYDGTGEI
jgi:hypothetical protein